MKTIKQISMTVGFCLTSYVAFCQPPTGTPPANNVNAQARAAWYRGGNFNTFNNNNIFGTMWNSPIHIFTSSTHRATWTTNNSLNSWNGNSGDGLRILNQSPFPSAGNLDLFTSFNAGTNETHIRFGNNGQVSGQNNRVYRTVMF
jgi:hypothetical protein